ncbi:FAD-linked oxidase C-terminal domain-containing protein [Rapidithrix thailandica]|uniref:FAD-linked oxidase C-terminal domain-containing protein n=1 Tax=Rapidithrix thailandica TaxID=413964 RepID=A0AAW9S2P7_9BACT
MISKNLLAQLSKKLDGEFYYNETMRTLYATDASAYREMPLAVALPKNKPDIQKLIHFANQHGVSLIPRTAGTSLAGQVVGSGIVVDVSKYFTQVLEVNKEEQWVRLQPGVIRDHLNHYLKPYDLYFGPETSTANRAMLGGMVGNNSCGSNSVVYGSTRDHLLEVKAFLSDGTETVFKALNPEEFEAKCQEGTLEGSVYRKVRDILSDKSNQEEIREGFPKPSIPRRNTGYALDLLMQAETFTESKEPFNFCKLIAGSEGTLVFITEIKVHVNPMPPAYKTLVCAHFDTVDQSLRANLIALKYEPSACELMDHYVLECTKTNIAQRQNRFFVKGDPGAILVVEISRHSEEEMLKDAQACIAEMKTAGLGYHFPIVGGEDIKKVWTLRKAGLGLLSNIPGDAKPVAVIEDTAVDVNDLPAFIAEFNETLKQHNLYCVHYAHAGSGELHLRPIINLKTEEGNRLFRLVAEEIARLVKKFKGSLSGEHGDGRLRGEFIRFMVGEKNYRLIKEIKQAFDPGNLLNPGKIVDTPPMNTSLRYSPGQDTPQYETVFDWSDSQGVLRAAELCNGSGDCRKTELSGGTMCPSYMATHNEKDTTRARANILREFLTHSREANPFAHQEIYEVMDLCLSCKGCKSECPSNVDVAKLKAEFLQHYYEEHGIPLRTKMIANISTFNRLGSLFPGLYNFSVSNPVIGSFLKNTLGFAPERTLPKLEKYTLRNWYKKHHKTDGKQTFKKKVYLFCDEFTDYNDTSIGVTTIRLLEKLGYEVEVPVHIESGRTYLSKGLLKEAKNIANRNIALLKDLVKEDTPLLGIEPSAILTFRDEYLDLASPGNKKAAKDLAQNTFLVDEFIAKEVDAGNITADQFTDQPQLIKLHGHCHQKSLSSLTPTKKILSLPANYEVHLIRSGCCGMAGSFGYEKEHYEISMKIGELVLFPTVRKQPKEVIIAAPGTSCRHQIMDGTQRKALHPVEILYNALR